MDLIIGLKCNPTHLWLRVNDFYDKEDGTFIISDVFLVVAPRERAMVSKEFLNVCNAALWDVCFTERQRAGVDLYCDIIARILDIN